MHFITFSLYFLAYILPLIVKLFLMQNAFIRSGLFLSFCAALLPSCRPRNITCTNGTIQVHPVGFSQTDFDSAEVIKYTQGSSFSEAVDSTRSIIYDPIYDGDTASIAASVNSNPDSTHPLFIVPGYDYKIVIPKLGRTFAITNIVQNGKTHESYTPGLIGGDKLVICYNSVISAMVDSNMFTGTADARAINIEIVK